MHIIVIIMKNIKKMKKIIISIITLCSFVAQAQNANKAKTLLDEVYNKMISYDNIYIEFRYNLDNISENINQEIKGNVTLAKDKYVLNYMGATKIYDGNKSYTIIPENEEVVIESTSEEETSITPSKMLTFYRKGYTYKWDIEQNVRGRKIQYVELKPQKASDVKQILLGIDVQTKHIYNLIEIGKNNTKTTITVNTFKTNQPIPANLFKFDKEKYKKEGYYISEL
ncbi:membrane protein [Capnocytophaga canis]|nr:membrane protein [Capnocytophaga canis]